VFAGDLFTLFLFWEILTVSATLLILARRTARARGAALRYFLVHVVGGLCLLAGIVIRYVATGSLAFDQIGLGGPGSLLIFIGFGINCAWPLLHNWLVDAYPEATAAGTVFLSAFTTKTAVYALVRSFPGTEALIWIGGAMTLFPIFFAVIENDLRRVLAYSMINQIGFMVVGIGIGTQLAINGAVAHAFNDILFKALLFMSMGAVLHRTGTTRATDLGGLYKSMPWTCAFCLVGAISISAFPLFSGFVSKSMVMEAVGLGNMHLLWFVLVFASAGVLEHAGVKIPFFAFFAHDSGIRCQEAPRNMLLAMGATAFLCIFIGCFPGYLYRLLPYATDYTPYTLGHVLSQTQLLCFFAMALALMMLAGVYPAEIRAINLDADWFYRKGGRLFYRLVDWLFNGLNGLAQRCFGEWFPRAVNRFFSEPGASMEKLLVLRYLKMTGASGTAMEMRRERIIRRYRYIAHPLGGGVLMAVVFLALMSYLYIIR